MSCLMAENMALAELFGACTGLNEHNLVKKETSHDTEYVKFVFYSAIVEDC